MNARHAALLALSVLVASPAWLAAQEDLSGPHGLERLLPAKPELQVTRPESGDPLFTLRGRDLPAAEFLALLAARGETQILIDDAAAEPLRTTIISIDLHERRADFTIDLIAAAAGCDVAREVHGFHISGPPATDSKSERPLAKEASHRFYEMALTRQRDPSVAANALRGTADLYKKSGDFAAAYGVYETLLSRFPRSTAARGADVLLADCFAAVGDHVRALNLLKNSLDRAINPEDAEAILHRVLVLLLADGRLREVEDLRDSLMRVAPLSPPTIAAVAEAAGAMENAGNSQGAILLLQDLWRADPERHAPLAPLLALALLDAGDSAESSRVIGGWVNRTPEAFDVPAALVACAELSRRAGNGPAALLFAERALTVPDSGVAAKLRAHLLIADVCESIGLDKRARRHLYEAEKVAKPAVAAKLALRSARLALEENEPEHARLLFQDALKYPAAHGEAEIGIARSLLLGNEPGRARDVIRELLDCDDLSPTITAAAIELGTESLLRLNAFEKAVALQNGDLNTLVADPAPGGAK